MKKQFTHDDLKTGMRVTTVDKREWVVMRGGDFDDCVVDLDDKNWCRLTDLHFDLKGRFDCQNVIKVTTETCPTWSIHNSLHASVS